MLHQDVKPDNILLFKGAYGVDDLVLADFGVGREVEENGPSNKRGVVVHQDHVAIEMQSFVNKIHGSIKTHADTTWKTKDPAVLDDVCIEARGRRSYLHVAVRHRREQRHV